MSALFSIVAICAIAAPVPSYTVHVRELTTPEQVIRVQLSSSDTVLDALTGLKQQLGDLGGMNLWIARRGAGGKSQLLRVDWPAISLRGDSSTNYQMLAGDRLFVQARPAK